MKIKSDAKSKITFKWFKTLNEKLQLSTFKTHVKAILVCISIFISVYLWNNVSGLISVLVLFYTILIVFNTERGESGCNIFLENLLWTLLVSAIFTLIGSTNVYDKPLEYKEVPIMKYELIESTEKMVIFPGKPFDNILVLNLPSTTFFSFRDSIKNGSIPIIKIKQHQIFDHIDKVFYNSQISETKYTLFVQVGNIEYSYGSVCNSNRDVTDECTKLFNDELKN